jgi:hypothetical protein
MTVQIHDRSDAILAQIAGDKSMTKVEVLRRLLAVLEIVHEQKPKGYDLVCLMRERANQGMHKSFFGEDE